MKVKIAIERLEHANHEVIMILHNRDCARKVINICTNDSGTVVWFEDSWDDNSKHLRLNFLRIEDITSLLKTFNPEATLKFHSESGPDVIFIKDFGPSAKYVLVEGEYDTCMESEIAGMFFDCKYADNPADEELEVYKYLLSMGIGVEMMRKYFGDGAAETMEKICKENGFL